MELAKVTSKGQITIPIDIRRKLGIKEGSKVLFIEDAGRIYIANSSMEALREEAELDRAKAACAIVSDLRRAEARADREGWLDDDDMRKIMGI